MTDHLKVLVDKARKVKMSAEQEEEQRQSFVYGNTNIENDLITRKMVSEKAKKLAE